MKKIISPAIFAGILALGALQAAQATLVVNTGAPTSPTMQLALDSNDSYAGRVSFAAPSTINAINGYVTGGVVGETFTIALYNSISNLPGILLKSATATYGSAGWNGVAGLSGWSVASGNYWLTFELGAADTLGSSSVTGALLPIGAPGPLLATAFNSGSGYVLDTPSALSFGLQVDAVSAVPLPAALPLLLSGLGLFGAFGKRKRMFASA